MGWVAGRGWLADGGVPARYRSLGRPAVVERLVAGAGSECGVSGATGTRPAPPDAEAALVKPPGAGSASWRALAPGATDDK